jgi:peptide-methionine (S)-S-oxide reductase
MSVIFYHNEEQKKLAEASKKERPKAATKILPALHWTNAEGYHQKYIAKARGTYKADAEDIEEGLDETRGGDCTVM